MTIDTANLYAAISALLPASALVGVIVWLVKRHLNTADETAKETVKSFKEIVGTIAHIDKRVTVLEVLQARPHNERKQDR